MISSNSRKYVEVRQPLKDIAFIRSKSDKNWPRYGASNPTHSKNDFCPTLADLTDRIMDEKYEQVMPSAKQQRLCTRVKPRVIFTIESVALLF